jgi:Trypsin
MRLPPVVAASLFAVAACAAPTADTSESRQASTQSIVGGSVSTPSQDAAVLLNEAGAPSCTGTLIAPNLVLTARHCVTYFNPNTECGAPLRGELGPSLVTVSVGVHATRQGWVARATKFFVPTAQDLCGGDIALVMLDDDVTGITPATVRFSPPTIGEVAIAVGYGDQGTGRRQREGVKVLALGPVTTSYKTANGQSLPMRLPANELATTESTCYGDSGGPLFDALGQIIGIASRGLDDLCNDRPTYWTTLAAYEALIRSAANAAGHPLPEATVPPGDNRNAASGSRGAEDASSSNDVDDGDDSTDTKRAHKRDASIGSAGCASGGARPDACFLWLGIGLVLVATRRRAAEIRRRRRRRPSAARERASAPGPRGSTSPRSRG